MRVALFAAVLALGSGACKFAQDFDGTHYSCNPGAPLCPGGQVCSRAGECVPADDGEGGGGGGGGGGGSGGDFADGGVGVDSGQQAANPPDAAVGSFLITFGERSNADVQGVTTDTFIDASAPDTNYGKRNDASFDSDPIRYALLRFDVSSLPSVVTVTGAQVVVYVFDPLEDGNCAIAPLTESWTAGGATYDSRDGNNGWKSPGGSMGSVGANVAMFTPNAVGEYAVPLPASLVQGWIDNPQSNFGIRFASTSVLGSGGQWDTQDIGDPTVRPLLKVTLTAAP